jgi:hypothetical protein
MMVFLVLIAMKTSFLLLLLAGLLYYHFQGSPVPRHAVADSEAGEKNSRGARDRNPAEGIVIAALPSYSERWKTGDNAQANLKTGPNAQTDFAPFIQVVTPPPSNGSPGYTSVSGVRVR